MLHGPRNSYPQSNVTSIIDCLGLFTNCELVLDAGTASSTLNDGFFYNGLRGFAAVPSFYEGTSGAGDGAEPTFNGTVGGRSKNEYYSFDGGDYFRLETANYAWMENIHKNSAIVTIAVWIMFGALGGSAPFCGTRGAAGTGTGFAFVKNATDTLQFGVRNGGSVVIQTDAVTTITEDVWHFCAVSLNEATGANGMILMLDDIQELFTSTYSSPAAGAASQVMEIGSAGNATNPLPATSRIASFTAWSRALPANELRAFHYATRGKFGV